MMTWGDVQVGNVVHHARGSSWLVIERTHPAEDSATLWLRVLHLDEGRMYNDSRGVDEPLWPDFWRLVQA